MSLQDTFSLHKNKYAVGKRRKARGDLLARQRGAETKRKVTLPKGGRPSPEGAARGRGHAGRGERTRSGPDTARARPRAPRRLTEPRQAAAHPRLMLPGPAAEGLRPPPAALGAEPGEGREAGRSPPAPGLGHAASAERADAGGADGWGPGPPSPRPRHSPRLSVADTSTRLPGGLRVDEPAGGVRPGSAGGETGRAPWQRSAERALCCLRLSEAGPAHSGLRRLQGGPGMRQGGSAAREAGARVLSAAESVTREHRNPHVK